MKIIIPRSIISKLFEHSLLQDPNECCGLLLGNNSEVVEILECKNIHDNPLTRYTIDPLQLLEAENYCDENYNAKEYNCEEIDSWKKFPMENLDDSSKTEYCNLVKILNDKINNHTCKAPYESEFGENEAYLHMNKSRENKYNIKCD